MHKTREQNVGVFLMARYESQSHHHMGQITCTYPGQVQGHHKVKGWELISSDITCGHSPGIQVNWFTTSICIDGMLPCAGYLKF